MMYPSVGHALDTIQAEQNGYETIVEFLSKHLQKKQI